MTRAKTKPPVRKPVFDAEGIVRFAALASPPADTAAEAPGEAAVEPQDERKASKKPAHDRQSITLQLSPEVIACLRAEAGRKGKTIEQIVEKLVTKHLGKH